MLGCFRERSRLVLCPGRQLALIQHLHLLLHRLELAAAKAQQLGRTLVATEHLLQRQLSGLDLRNQLLQLLQSGFVAGGLIGFFAAAALGMGDVGLCWTETTILGAPAPSVRNARKLTGATRKSPIANPPHSPL